MASGTRKRALIGIIVGVVALLTVATTVFAAGSGRHGFIGSADNGQAASNQTGNNGPGDRGFGPRAIVTAVDTTNQTITLGGLPQQIATVKIDQNVKLVSIQPDGTTKDAAIGDFKTGSLVEVRFQFNGRNGHGRGPGQPNTGANPSSNGNGQGQPNATVTQLALVPAGQVRIEGLVTATGGTLTVVDGGGLQLTVATTGSTKVTKGTATAGIGDIKVGDRVTATGTQNGATVNAGTVRIFDPSAMRQARTNPGTASPTAKP